MFNAYQRIKQYLCKLWKYFAMTLISTKLETFLCTHGTKMLQCLPFYLWRTSTFEVYKFGKNQGFEKVKLKTKEHSTGKLED